MMTRPFVPALPAGMDCALSESGDRTESREVADAVIEAISPYRPYGSLWLPLAHDTGGFAMPSPAHTPSTPTRPQTPPRASGLKIKTNVKAGIVFPATDCSTKEAA